MVLAQLSKKYKPLLGFLLSWIFLNVLMNLKYPAPEVHWLAPLVISPEVLGILILIWALSWLGLRFYLAVYLPLTACIVFLRLFRIGDNLVPMYFFRPFNLFLDSRFLPDLIHLLYSTFSFKAFILFITLVITLLIGITGGVWLSLRTIHGYLSNHYQRRLILLLFFTGLMAMQYLPSAVTHNSSGIFAQGLMYRVLEEFDFILHVNGYRKKHLASIQTVSDKRAKIPSSLDRLKGADVYLFLIESYGHTIFADKGHFQKIERFLDSVEKDLKAREFSICSAFLDSPTYGGSSWLAHATLAGGVYLNNQMKYNLLITSDAKTMAHFFNDAGYRTISAMPGTQWPWPEGAFFGYQQKYYAWNFDYQGPAYGWTPMPDQYVLDFIYRHEIQGRTQPIFIEFILVSSHAPFHRQPPFLKDWSQIKNGTIYNHKEMVTFPVVWPDLSNASEAYVTAITYDLTVISDFIQHYLSDQALVIVLGDHQPNVQITGKGQTWSVPVHIISRNQELLKPFYKRGYTPGLIPTQLPPHRGMETFLFEFLSDFSTPDSNE